MPTSSPPDPAFATDRDLRQLQLVLGRKKGKVYDVKKVNIDGDIQSDLREAALASLDRLAALRQMTYTTESAFEPGEEYAFLPAGEFEQQSAMLSSLAPLAFPTVTRDELAGEFQYFAYVCGPAGHEIVFISKFNPRRGLKKKLVTTWSGAQLMRTDDPVLAFDPYGVDMIWAPGVGLVAFDVSVLDFLLRDASVIAAQAPVLVDVLTASVPVSDDSREVLERFATRDVRVWRKLSAIEERGHLRNVSITEIRKALKERDYDPADYIAQNKLEFTDENVLTLLMLLNEDIFTGPFSHQRLAAERKTTV
jgi:hypothetical protein